jgi:hypothetical protein
MPHVIVTTSTPKGPREDVVLNERVTLSDLESEHFCAQLVERLGWAMHDAEEFERERSPVGAGAYGA